MSDSLEGRTRLLMIDDDRKLCRLVATYLQPLGFDVMAVHSGPEVWNAPSRPSRPGMR
jgi:DNA-binding response OmpR family regulator